MRIMFAMALVVFVQPAVMLAQDPPAGPKGIGLISPVEAKALIDNPDPAKRPLVLDTRGGYKDYFKGHLPTAHHINFDTLRGTDKGVPVAYLPDDLTRILLSRAGVDKDRLHILYAQGDKLPNDEILSSSMVAYVLEKFGIKNIRILDGGIEAYKAKFPLTQEYPNTPMGKLPKEMNPGIGMDVDTVLKLKEMPNYILLDARPRSEYEGNDPYWLRKGHIPGARSFHWARLMTDDNTHKFRSVDECKKILAEEGITPDKNVLVYCGTSREGSLLRFTLRHVLGYPNVLLYEGSWREYAGMKNLPVEKGPGPGPLPKAPKAGAAPVAPPETAATPAPLPKAGAAPVAPSESAATPTPLPKTGNAAVAPPETAATEVYEKLAPRRGLFPNLRARLRGYDR